MQSQANIIHVFKELLNWFSLISAEIYKIIWIKRFDEYLKRIIKK